VVETLYDLPVWLLALIIVGGFTVFAIVGHALTHRWVHEHWSESRDAVGVVVASAATLYAVLLAMIAVAVWSNYITYEDRVREEANIVGNLYRDTEGQPAAQSVATKALLRQYATVVATKEWPEMHIGRYPDASSEVVAALMMRTLKTKPIGLGEANVQAEFLGKLNRLFELRRLRQESVRKGLPPVLWGVVVFGGALTIMLGNLLTAEDGRLSILLAAGMAMMIGLMVFLIFSMDRPLMGEISIEPVAFEQVMKRMETLDRTVAKIKAQTPSLEATAAK
jgi:hypothetical protein